MTEEPATITFFIYLEEENFLNSGGFLVNFDYDSDQDGGHTFTFKEDFGRSTFGNPCLLDGPSPLVAKTGQNTPYATGDDGDLGKDMAWPVRGRTIITGPDLVLFLIGL